MVPVPPDRWDTALWATLLALEGRLLATLLCVAAVAWTPASLCFFGNLFGSAPSVEAIAAALRALRSAAASALLRFSASTRFLQQESNELEHCDGSQNEKGTTRLLFSSSRFSFCRKESVVTLNLPTHGVRALPLLRFSDTKFTFPV